MCLKSISDFHKHLHISYTSIHTYKHAPNTYRIALTKYLMKDKPVVKKKYCFYYKTHKNSDSV